jgi:hypothetical protein
MNSILYSDWTKSTCFCYLIKYFIIILCSFNINYNKIEINLDNELAPKYEKNINYSNYSSIIKPIALYYPEFININVNYFNINSINASDYKTYINQSNIYFENGNKLEKFKNQTKLARNHGIYGFAICFVFEFNSTYLDEISFFVNNKEIEFPFFLI